MISGVIEAPLATRPTPKRWIDAARARARAARTETVMAGLLIMEVSSIVDATCLVRVITLRRRCSMVWRASTAEASIGRVCRRPAEGAHLAARGGATSGPFRGQEEASGLARKSG